MAIARPVRALGLAALLMWIFFLYTILKPTPGLVGPDKYKTFERDPQLDRMLVSNPIHHASVPGTDRFYFQPSRNPKENYGERRKTMRQTRRTPRELMRPC